MAYVPEPERTGGGRQGPLAVTFLILALAASYLPETAQQGVAWSIRQSVLKPFIGTHERLVEARFRASHVDSLQTQVDLLTAQLATHRALADENRTLRETLALRDRVGPEFLPATVLRPGTPGSESMFFVELGSADGIAEGAPVMNLHGLVGVIREVRERISVGMDWTHPDFRPSAMLEDGSGFGIVEVQRGTFREEDRLVLRGGAYHQDVADGTVVLTSGLGGVLPRGIPIGTVDGLEAVQGRWGKSYWLRPMVEVGGVTHVLVGKADAATDLLDAWAADSLLVAAGAEERQ